MQQRLASLGFAMSVEPIPNFNQLLPLEEDEEPDQHIAGDRPMGQLKTGSSRTAGRSAHDTGIGDAMKDGQSPSAQRPLKRSRVDSPTTANNIHIVRSNRVMPPPSKPLSKIKSMREIIPNLRNKLTNGRSPGRSTPKNSSDMDAQMDDTGDWEVVNAFPKRAGAHDQHMTGALPVEDGPVYAPAQSRFLPGLGIHNNASEFTFQSPSTSAMPPRSGKLPNGPSYMRLFDDLDQHAVLDFGLEDPRDRVAGNGAYVHPPEQYLRRPQPENDVQRDFRTILPKLQTQNHQKQWNFGHAFLEQSPINANPHSTYKLSGQDLDRNDDAIRNHSQNRIITNPITPAPTRFQRSTDEVDNVVSPFSESSSHRSRPLPRSQFTEHDISSSRSGAYQSRNQKPSLGSDWRESRSLNGLSFFDTPVNERNERIGWRRETQPQELAIPQTQHRRRYINSQGFLVRPDAARSPDGYGAFELVDQFSSRRPPTHSAISFPSVSRPAQLQATRLPSAMPSMILGSSPRRRPPAHNVDLPGVRSSHHPRAYVSGGAVSRSARLIPSSTRRRVIRR